MSRVFREDLCHYYCTPLSQNWKLRLSPHYSNPFQCILPSLKIKSQFYNIKSTSGSTLHITLSKSSMKYTFQVPLPQEILGSLRTPRFEIRFWVKGRFFLCEPSHYSNYNITCTNMVVDVIWTFFLALVFLTHTHKPPLGRMWSQYNKWDHNQVPTVFTPHKFERFQFSTCMFY